MSWWYMENKSAVKLFHAWNIEAYLTANSLQLTIKWLNFLRTNLVEFLFYSLYFNLWEKAKHELKHIAHHLWHMQISKHWDSLAEFIAFKLKWKTKIFQGRVAYCLRRFQRVSLYYFLLNTYPDFFCGFQENY